MGLFNEMARQITDLSFSGSTLTIAGILIQDFMDDKNPFEVQDADATNIEWSCNGKMIRTVKPTAVMISVTVIPGSSSDLALRRIWRRCMCNNGDVSLGAADQELTCSIVPKNPHIPGYQFSHGTCVSGSPAASVSAQGKAGGNTYTFAFAKV